MYDSGASTVHQCISFPLTHVGLLTLTSRSAERVVSLSAALLSLAMARLAIESKHGSLRGQSRFAGAAARCGGKLSATQCCQLWGGFQVPPLDGARSMDWEE